MNRVAMLLLIGTLTVAGEAPAQTQCPELPFYVLVPFNYPCPIHPRVCHTQYGYCRLPVGIRPGTPCSCLAANGAQLSGVCLR